MVLDRWKDDWDNGFHYAPFAPETPFVCLPWEKRDIISLHLSDIQTWNGLIFHSIFCLSPNFSINFISFPKWIFKRLKSVSPWGCPLATSLEIGLFSASWTFTDRDISCYAKRILLSGDWGEKCIQLDEYSKKAEYTCHRVFPKDFEREWEIQYVCCFLLFERELVHPLVRSSKPFCHWEIRQWERKEESFFVLSIFSLWRITNVEAIWKKYTL